MLRRSPRTAVAAAATTAVLAGLGLTAPVAAASPVAAAGQAGAAGAVRGAARCSAGAHTLAAPGSRMYPDTGNGGYTSVHTAVHLVYDAAGNRFLPGNHVVLTDRATQCLTSFSLDFERRSVSKTAGPDMSVRSVTVDGHPAPFRFVQPTYSGDPHGQNDPNPLAHQASQLNPVGGPHHNPLPPACSPELTSTSPARQNSRNGTPCPANKLVITPRRVIPDGSVFTVSVSYTGRPGVHNDGDGTTEGWFRSRDGGFVTTEPVGSEDWMPLNDYPAAKPTYDFYDTVGTGLTGVANGILVSRTPHGPGAEFPHGSVTWHWHMRSPVASYLVEDSIGRYRLTERTADNGIRFYQAQDGGISAKQQAKNRAIMSLQQNITEFESQFSGSFPFSSDGVIIGTPQASFEEEMETMITFSGGVIDTDTLYHENMHQWWGDNVTEGGYAMTFYKEGLATLAEYLYAARRAETAAGGPYSRQGPGRVPGQPGQAVQGGLRRGRHLLDAGAVRPDAVQPVRRGSDLRPAGRDLHRAAADPGPRQLHPGPGAHPARVRRRQHHRAGTGGGLPRLAAQPERGLPGPAGRVLPPVVRHRLRDRRRRAPAADHRPGPGRPGLLRRPRLPPQLAGDAAGAPEGVR